MSNRTYSRISQAFVLRCWHCLPEQTDWHQGTFDATEVKTPFRSRRHFPETPGDFFLPYAKDGG